MFPSADLPLPSVSAPALRVRGVDAVLALLSTSEEPPDHGSPAAIARTTTGLAGESTSASGSLVSPPKLATQEGASPASAGAAPVRPGQNAAHPHSGSDPAANLKENVSLGTIARALAAATSPGTPATTASLSLPAINASIEESGKFANALESTVRNSGVFYESHLLDWVEGRTTLEAIRAEPRAAAVNVASPQTAAAVRAETMLPTRADLQLAGTVQPQQDLPTAFRPEAITAAQLHCAEANEIHIHAEVWPGQTADMVLHTPERGPRQHGANLAEPALPGSGVLKLSLPELGDVEARIHTDGNEVRYSLCAKDPETAAKLRGSTAALAYGLGMAGLKLVSANVDDHAH